MLSHLRRDINLKPAIPMVLVLLFSGLFPCGALNPFRAYARNDGASLPSTAALSHMTHTILLAEEKVWVNIHESRRPGLTFVNLHDNENTSAQAARIHISRHGGRLVELAHGRGREVVIRRRGVLHRFDPNRMFTEDGLRQTLKYFHNLNENNVAVAADFARKVEDLIGIEKGKVIIDVHNNTPDKLTIHDFKAGRWYGPDTREVFVNPAEDPDDFFFTNSTALFRALKALRRNAALMATDPPDRGSLGNAVNNTGGIYVLVEAEHGHLTRQIGMLEDLARLLEDGFPAGN